MTATAFYSLTRTQGLWPRNVRFMMILSEITEKRQLKRKYTSTRKRTLMCNSWAFVWCLIPLHPDAGGHITLELFGVA